MPDNSRQTDSKGTVLRLVKCPTCRKNVVWKESEIYRPFCSRKCQLVDFGEWASERHSIPSDSPPDEFDPDSGDQES